jgi:nucleotide-binding universal stress UspA family protein
VRPDVAPVTVGRMDVTPLAARGQQTTAVDDLPDLVGREVVVGYDATPAADAAVRWAALEAARLRSTLTVVCAVDPGAVDGGHTELTELARVGRELARRGAEVAHRAAPDGRPARVVGASGSAAGELVARSASAALLVVGAPRLRGVAALGSVSFGVTLHARCPVVLVPEGTELSHRYDVGDVVAGVDGSRASRTALELAAQLALARDRRLRVVTAWLPTPVPRAATAGAVRMQQDAVRQDVARQDVAAAVEHVQRRHPGLQVTGSAVRGHAVDVLVASARDAGLLVVGSRGQGGFAGLALGSVSHAVVRAARVPVAVVRQGWW